MIGAASRQSRSPSSPTSAGQAPVFRQPAAASRNASGGSSNETNSPRRTPRMVCVEISERINASSRLLWHASSSGVRFKMHGDLEQPVSGPFRRHLNRPFDELLYSRDHADSLPA